MTSTDLQHFYAGKRVFVTGHTGFKGSWLCWWLHEMGAEVTGLALPPEDLRGNHFNATQLGDVIPSIIADIREPEPLKSALCNAAPDIVFHLAAQPYVRASYADPVVTMDSNVMGTVHVLEAVRQCQSVKSVVIVTTDKCYENRETMRAYDESDPLGGHDPYSASKAMAELATQSYRRSFLGEIGLASARAGNVLGGGDFGQARLIPDLIEALQQGQPLLLRHPDAIRPWQHVLDVLHGYLRLAQCLWDEPTRFSSAYNFSPPANAEDYSVRRLCETMLSVMARPDYPLEVEPANLHEATLLRLNPDKARGDLGWQTQLSTQEAIEWTAAWYHAAWLERSKHCRSATLEQIARYQQMSEV